MDFEVHFSAKNVDATATKLAVMSFLFEEDEFAADLPWLTKVLTFSTDVKDTVKADIDMAGFFAGLPARDAFS